MCHLYPSGRSYNFPIQLWLMDSFPFTPPICLLRPTHDMVIREGKHVDARGRIYLPGLHNWDYVRRDTLRVKTFSGGSVVFSSGLLLFSFLLGDSPSRPWWFS